MSYTNIKCTYKIWEYNPDYFSRIPNPTKTLVDIYFNKEDAEHAVDLLNTTTSARVYGHRYYIEEVEWK